MSDFTKEWFEQSYRELTDDEEIAKARRKHERKDRIEEKKADTGYEA
jgi:hypothetical protein